jgi:hypothetical protein
MATLYTLDWYKRNYGTPPYPPPPAVTVRPLGGTTSANAPGEIIEVKTTPTPLWRPPTQPDVPMIAPCKDAQCQMYCCGDQHVYKTDSGSKGASSVDVVVALPGTKPDDNKYAAKDANEPSYRARRYASSDSAIVSNSVLPRQSFDVRIDIPDFNITLDQRWCIGGACQRPKEGRFDLYIPISTYMPTIPLEIVFE